MSTIGTDRARPLLAHLYTNGWIYGQNNNPRFKKMLGPIVNYPVMKYGVNYGHSPMDLWLPALDSAANAPVRGDIVTLTEQGGDGTVIYTGIIEDLPENLSTSKSEWGLTLQPLSVELGYTPFTVNYSLVDPAVMVRAAVTATKNLTWTAATIPLTGLVRSYDFSFTGTSLKVLEETIKMGSNLQYFVDEVGQVYFGTSQTLNPTYTVKRGQDYDVFKGRASISKLCNYVVCIGGVAPGTKDSIACVYDGGTLIPCTSATIPAPNFCLTSAYGCKARMPHYRFPKLLDQTTLNNMAATIGAQLNRPQTKIELTLRGFPQRIQITSYQGATMRYWEPSSTEGMDVAKKGKGTYSPTYLVSDVEVHGTVQKVLLTDIVTSDDQLQYSIDKMLEDLAAQAGTSIQNNSVGIITPGQIVGATGGGPSIPTTPVFFP